MKYVYPAVGSPPHTRDKWVSGNTKEHKDRITPAYAGQMNFVIDEISIKGDHPRIRGTNSAALREGALRAGSPPHTRDKCQYKIPENAQTGITPAYAGQIGRKRSKDCAEWDHPRIRGTNHPELRDHHAERGSPPHTRDKYLKIP